MPSAWWRHSPRSVHPLGEHGVSAADLCGPGVVYQIGVPPNRIDILTAVEGLVFGPCWTRRAVSTYGGAKVAYLGKQDLIVNNRAVGRPQDLEDIRAMERGPH